MHYVMDDDEDALHNHVQNINGCNCLIFINFKSFE